MTQAEAVKDLWQFAYNLLRGPGRSFDPFAGMTLPDRFDDDLLNGISKLASLQIDTLPTAVEEVRGQVYVCHVNKLVGDKDFEIINSKLDAIAFGTDKE